jgi:hypothetical protein
MQAKILPIIQYYGGTYPSLHPLLEHLETNMCMSRPGITPRSPVASGNHYLCRDLLSRGFSPRHSTLKTIKYPKIFMFSSPKPLTLGKGTKNQKKIPRCTVSLSEAEDGGRESDALWGYTDSGREWRTHSSFCRAFLFTWMMVLVSSIIYHPPSSPPRTVHTLKKIRLIESNCQMSLS